jgi:hypothetical protein
LITESEPLGRGPSSLQEIAQSILGLLSPIAATRAGIDAEDFHGRVRLDFRDSSVINAGVHSDDNWQSFSIVMNQALMIFYHKMLKVFASTIGIGKNEQEASERPTAPPKKILSVSKKLLIAFEEGTILRQKSFYAEELGKGQTAIVGRLVNACECFDIAHEIGHAIYGIKNKQVPEQALAVQSVVGFLADIQDLSQADKEALIEPWTEEICADLIGLNLTLSQPCVPPYNSWPNYKQYLCGGAEISHLLQMMIGEFIDRRHFGSRIALVSTHPHDYLRWKAISRSPDKAAITDNIGFGKMFGNFTMWILNSLFQKDERGEYQLR